MLTDLNTVGIVPYKKKEKKSKLKDAVDKYVPTFFHFAYNITLDFLGSSENTIVSFILMSQRMGTYGNGHCKY